MDRRKLLKGLAAVPLAVAAAPFVPKAAGAIVANTESILRRIASATGIPRKVLTADPAEPVFSVQYVTVPELRCNKLARLDTEMVKAASEAMAKQVDAIIEREMLRPPLHPQCRCTLAPVDYVDSSRLPDFGAPRAPYAAVIHETDYRGVVKVSDG